MFRFIFALTVLLVVPGFSGNVESAEITYSGSVEKDESTGWNIIQLNAVNPDNPKENISIKITPEGGCNMFSINVGGNELVSSPANIGRFSRSLSGIPVLFPTPNRVRNQTYTFMGEEYQMTFPGDTQRGRLHGLVWDDSAWKFSEPEKTADGIMFKSWYVFDESNPRFSGYPFLSTLTLTFTLSAGSVRVDYEVENQDSKPLGFGFGLHPYWSLIDTKDDMRIQADIPNRMLGENKLPSGELAPVEGTTYSLLEPTQLTTLNLDDVYFGATPESNIRIMYDKIGLNIIQKASAEFTHVVVYTPRNAVCVENQTCSTDTHNLYSKGFEKESNLQIVEPGKKTDGYIEYLLEWRE
ncbi:aldose 1-epimerase [Candidatus Latescibacterota bacterium]